MTFICAPCGLDFATLTDFDRHQASGEGGRPAQCLDPSSLGLELRRGTWGTPEGNIQRDRKAARLRKKLPGVA